MYKKIMITAAAIFAAAAMGSVSAFAADSALVELAAQSCAIDANLEKNGDVYNTQSAFVADRDMKMVVVSDNDEVGVRVQDASGTVKGEKSANMGYVTVEVKKGERYTVSLVALRDDADASVYVYGI